MGMYKRKGSNVVEARPIRGMTEISMRADGDEISINGPAVIVIKDVGGDTREGVIMSLDEFAARYEPDDMEAVADAAWFLNQGHDAWDIASRLQNAPDSSVNVLARQLGLIPPDKPASGESLLSRLGAKDTATRQAAENELLRIAGGGGATQARLAQLQQRIEKKLRALLGEHPDTEEQPAEQEAPADVTISGPSGDKDFPLHLFRQLDDEIGRLGLDRLDITETTAPAGISPTLLEEVRTAMRERNMSRLKCVEVVPPAAPTPARPPEAVRSALASALGIPPASQLPDPPRPDAVLRPRTQRSSILSRSVDEASS